MLVNHYRALLLSGDGIPNDPESVQIVPVSERPYYHNHERNSPSIAFDLHFQSNITSAMNYTSLRRELAHLFDSMLGCHISEHALAALDIRSASYDIENESEMKMTFGLFLECTVSDYQREAYVNATESIFPFNHDGTTYYLVGVYTHGEQYQLPEDGRMPTHFKLSVNYVNSGEFRMHEQLVAKTSLTMQLQSMGLNVSLNDVRVFDAYCIDCGSTSEHTHLPLIVYYDANSNAGGEVFDMFVNNLEQDEAARRSNGASMLLEMKIFTGVDDQAAYEFFLNHYQPELMPDASSTTYSVNPDPNAIPDELFRPRTRTAFTIPGNGQFALFTMPDECSRFCVQLAWNSMDEDEFYLESIDTKDPIASSILNSSTSPLIRSRNNTVWTLSLHDPAMNQMDLIFNIKRNASDSALSVRVIAHLVSATQASSSVTGISYDGAHEVTYSSRLLNGNQLALYLSLMRATGTDTWDDEFGSPTPMPTYTDGSPTPMPTIT